MGKKTWFPIGLLIVLLLSACGSQQTSQKIPSQPILSDGINIEQRPSPTPTLVVPQQVVTPTPTAQTIPPLAPPANIPGTGVGSAPYGPPPPLTTEEVQLTQQLFALINHDRAIRGLYPFVWNATLAGGARLHSWNMFHCGFSHTCPDGLNQCTRIANEGFAGYTDCGENIALAGPSSPPWTHVYAVQESMINEPPTGWHRIHLTSTTLHRIGVGVYVAPNGWVWFTEDMVS